MTENDPVEREDGATFGRYVIRLPGNEEAEMTYRKVGPGVISVDHTYVPPAFRDHKLALKLVLAGVNDARAEGVKIIPRCSYVAIQFRRHPDWSDLLAG